MKRYVFVAFCLLGFQSGCGTDPAVDKAAIKKTFDKYKTAILAMNGEAAADAVSQETLDEYQEYVDLARSGDRAAVKALSPLRKMQVLLLRHRVPRDKWKDITTGRAAFIYGVNNDWIGRKRVAAMTLGEINVYVFEAGAEVLEDNRNTHLRFDFVKKNGDWKLDLATSLMATDAAMKAMIKRARKSEDEFVFDAVEAVCGVRPTEAVWNPPKI